MLFCVNRCSSVHDAPTAEGRRAVGLAYGTKNVPVFLSATFEVTPRVSAK